VRPNPKRARLQEEEWEGEWWRRELIFSPVERLEGALGAAGPDGLSAPAEMSQFSEQN
jgi:hypothetical protein